MSDLSRFAVVELEQPALAVTRDRLPGNSLGAVGPLDGTTSPVPLSRVSSVRYAYDSANRLTETDNFGTNPVIPGSSGALVTKQSYDSAGNVQYSTDASNTETYYQYDNLGRVKVETDNYVPGQAANAGPALMKVTNYTYNCYNEVTVVSVNDIFPSGIVPPGLQVNASGLAQEPQTTTYNYGTTGSLDPSKLSVVHYPNNTSQSYWYDWLGDVVLEAMPDSTVHHYEYDSLGRQTLDYAVAGPQTRGVDFMVTALATTYDVLNRPVTMSSDSGGMNNFTPLNQVKDVYDAFGNLSIQYQDGAGAVPMNPAGIPAVQYNYDLSKPTQLDSMTYPDGRVEWYTYSGIDATVGRVSTVDDPTSTGADGQTIESYTYMGVDTVVGKTRPAENVTESIGLDAYGRVGSVQWSGGTSVGVTDSFTYTYDNVGDVLSSENDVNGIDSESYGYDALHRQTSLRRGTLVGNISSGALVNVSWTLDSQGNKYVNPAQPAGDKYGNQYGTGDQKAPASSYTPIGNQQTVTWDSQRSAGLVYDAWGRVVSATSFILPNNNPSNRLSAVQQDVYAYDALGREISDSSGGSGTNYSSVVRLYYSGQNVIEERNGATGATPVVSAQYVWSAAGPNTMILRDSETSPAGTSSFIPQITGQPLNQRLYAQDNGQGSITSITDVAGVVQERYLYDQDGQPTATDDNGNPWPTTPAGLSHFNWVYLWHGGRYATMLANLTAGVEYGLYTFAAGSSWYDPYHGVSLQPNYNNLATGQSPYVPYGADASFWDRHAAGIAIGATVAASLAVTIASAGALAGLGAEMTLGTMALLGAAGGVVGGFGNSYAGGNGLSRVAADTAVGGIAGGVGGAVGGAVAGQFCPAAIGGYAAAGFVGGTAGGVIQGGYSGYQTGGWSGAFVGAAEGGLTGGLLGLKQANISRNLAA